MLLRPVSLLMNVPNISSKGLMANNNMITLENVSMT